MTQYFAEALGAIACSGAAPNSCANNFAGGMILGIAHNFDAAADLHDRIPLRDGVDSIVRSLGVTIRTKLADQVSHVVLRKNDDSVHVRQCLQNFRAFIGWHQWAA